MTPSQCDVISDKKGNLPMPNGVTDSPAAGAAIDLKKQVGPIEMSVEVLIFLFFKAFSAMRTYNLEHPLFQNSLQHLCQTFDEFFEAHDQLKIEISESEILFHGEVVYQEQDKRGSIIYMLFNDGVREIRFERGLEHDEIRHFLDALRLNTELPQEERDIVSLLWSRDFDHIHYFAFDEIPDQAADYVDRGISKLEGIVPELDPENLTTITNDIQSQAANDPLASTIESPIVSQMMAKSQDAIENLLDSLNEERTFDAESELIAIILDVLRLEDNTDRSLSVLKLLENYSDDFLARGSFAQVNRIIMELQSLSEQRKSISPLLTQHIDDILKRFAEEKVYVLGKVLNTVPAIQSDDLHTFITLLHQIAIEPICDLLEEIPDPKIRTILCQALETLARGETTRLGAFLKKASELAARDIVNVLGKIGDDTATAILKTCVKHSSAIVREEAIRALRRISTRQAQEAMILFLSDVDPAIRTAAAEGIEACKTRCRIDPLLPIVQEKIFNKRGFREKKALLSILGNEGSEQSIHILGSLLSKKGLFNRKQYDETRTCAAMALGKIHSDTAITILERYSRDSSPSVKKACVQALNLREKKDCPL